MTVSRTIQSSHVHEFAINFTQLINLTLFALCAAALLYYVVWSNGFAANNYRVSTLRENIARLTEINSTLLAEKSAMENPVAAMEFAQRQHMVPASNTSYIFENGNVALRSQ